MRSHMLGGLGSNGLACKTNYAVTLNLNTVVSLLPLNHRII